MGSTASAPAVPMGYQQGKIVTWDPVTLANKVLVDGTVFTDLPILGLSEAATYASGVTVGIVAVGSTWGIIGRWVRPNTSEATDAITQISQRTASATIATSESTASNLYTDLATIGPSVAVNIAASGRALVSVGAVVGLISGGFSAMSFAVTGATTQAPDDERAYIIADTLMTVGSTKQVTVEGLNPGAHIFTAKYRAVNETVAWFERTIAVQAL